MRTQQSSTVRVSHRAGEAPKAIQELVAELAGQGLSDLEIDAPNDPSGEWFIDLAIGEFRTTLGYRPDAGFGIHTSEAVYGSRPDEVFTEPHQAVIRLRQLAEQWAKEACLRSPSLRDLRHLVGMHQAVVARACGGDQTSISRLEMRNDHKISTVSEYVKALGGRLELRVRFDSFEAPIHIGGDEPVSDNGKGEAHHAT